MKVRILDGRHLTVELLAPLHAAFLLEWGAGGRGEPAPDWPERSRSYLRRALAAVATLSPGAVPAAPPAPGAGPSQGPHPEPPGLQPEPPGPHPEPPGLQPEPPGLQPEPPGPHPERAVLRLAEVNGQPVGLAIGWVRETVPEAALAGGPVLWVTDLYVDPAHRHVGIGRRLLESVIRGARQGGAVAACLPVPPGSHAAALGREAGFVPVPDLTLLRRPLVGSPQAGTESPT